MDKEIVLLCGPPLSAVGGGPTHMRSILSSPLSRRYRLVHFETGSRGTESPAKDERLGVRIARVVTSPFLLAWTILRVRPGLIHINSAMDYRAFWRDLVYFAVCRLLFRKVVLQLHGGSLEELCAPRWMRRVVATVYSLPHAVVVLANSELRDFARLGLVERVCAIPNGVDVSQYCEPHGRPHRGRIRRVGFMGRLIRAKGVFEVMEAVRLLRIDPEFAELELQIAGSGLAEKEIRRQLQEDGMEPWVQLRGPLHCERKIDFLKEIDVLVFPTYHQEGLPYVILESLAAGTPVIATRNAGIPDVIIDRVHGRLIDPKEPIQIVAALREMNRSPAIVQAMSHECVQRAREAFSLERVAVQFQDLYESLEMSGGTANATSNRI